MTPFEHEQIKAALDGLDQIARVMELKWGIGRLPLLVTDDLRIKFERQLRLVDKFLWNDDAAAHEIIGRLQAMGRAWGALDAAAVAAGHEVKPAVFLECPLPDGGICAIMVEGSGGELPADGRRIAIYSTAEIGRMIAAAADLLIIKKEFPGAVVSQVRVKRPAYVDLDDPVIPF